METKANNSLNQAAVYNLNAVMRETGISADVLRAWEKRYHLPKPQRSKGGHRLYSQSDIETLKWLKARQQEGLSISRAVELWQEHVASGENPFTRYQSPLVPVKNILRDTEPRMDDLRAEWLEACLNFDESRAENALNQAFALYPVETVCTAVLQQGLNFIGSNWYSGKISTQQEHFTSGLAIRRIESLLLATPQPIREQTILLGCPEGELHTFPVLLLNLFLRRKGLKVVYLGADIPTTEFENTAAVIRPNLIVLSAQRLAAAAALRKVSLSLPGYQVAYGGLIFKRIPDLRTRIPAHFLGEGLEEGLQRIEDLLTSQPATLLSANEPVIPLETIRVFSAKRAWIELEITETLQKTGFSNEVIQRANQFFGDGLIAALELGNPAYLEADMEWLRELVSNRHISDEQLSTYLTVYSEVISAKLNSPAEPIRAWIDQYRTRL